VIPELPLLSYRVRLRFGRDVEPLASVTSAGAHVACHLHITGNSLGGASVRELERGRDDQRTW
jgi:hypothetical protein